MRVFRLIYVMYKINLLSPIGIYRLIASVKKCGINLLMLLHFAEKKYSQRIALVDDHETLTYWQLLTQSEKLAICLRAHIRSGQKVGILCKNHASLVKSVFAVSRLGADLYFLNTEINKHQFNKLVERTNFDVLIYDEELAFLLEQSIYSREKILSYHHSLPAINNFLNTAANENEHLPRLTAGKIVLQTSGTTGLSKDAAYKPSLFNYLNPFAGFIKRLKVLNYKTAYIGTPIFHGYGIAVLLLFIPLGKKVVISREFDTGKACKLVRDHNVEFVTVVPLMLERMLGTNPEVLKSLACIASGGAKLNPGLVDKTFKELGSVLYNLYGTSEAGLNFIATPEDLMYSSSTIGKKINGMRLKVLDEHVNEVENEKVGQFYIKNNWSISNKGSAWIETGDLGYRDDNGYYFLSGRKDDMIISGGENVYPIELEKVLITHPLIGDVAVIGVTDKQFGQRLKAFVMPTQNANITEEEIMVWLRPRVSRFQMPKRITFVDSMPYTSLGKLDKKALRNNSSLNSDFY